MCWCDCCCCYFVTCCCLLCPWSTHEKVVVTWSCSFLKAFRTPPCPPWDPNILLHTLFVDVLWVRDLIHNNTWICVYNFIFALVDKHKDKSFYTEHKNIYLNIRSFVTAGMSVPVTWCVNCQNRDLLGQEKVQLLFLFVSSCETSTV
jgi:hypothetical protein